MNPIEIFLPIISLQFYQRYIYKGHNLGIKFIRIAVIRENFLLKSLIRSN